MVPSPWRPSATSQMAINSYHPKDVKIKTSESHNESIEIRDYYHQCDFVFSFFGLFTLPFICLFFTLPEPNKQIEPF